MANLTMLDLKTTFHVQVELQGIATSSSPPPGLYLRFLIHLFQNNINIYTNFIIQIGLIGNEQVSEM